MRWRAAGLMTVVAALGVGCNNTAPTPSPPASPPKLTVSVATTTGAAAPIPSPSEAPAVVMKRYRGRIYLSEAERMADEPSMEPRIISDKQAYQAFVAKIPKRRIQMKQPAPPSDDPLLAMPALDFKQATLVVALRADTMYVHPELAVSRDSEKVVVQVTYPPMGDTAMAAAQAGVGTYAAALISAPAEAIIIE